MLYLVKLQGKELTLLKIGHTKDIEKRIKTYQTHNPLIELLDYKEGNSTDAEYKEYINNLISKGFLIQTNDLDKDIFILNNAEIKKVSNSNFNTF